MFAFKVANCNLDKQKLEWRLLALKRAIKQNQVIDIFLVDSVDGLSVRDTSDYIDRLSFFVDKHSRTLWLMDKKGIRFEAAAIGTRRKGEPKAQPLLK